MVCVVILVKVQTLLEWPVPSNVTELRQLLGLVGYYRRFIQNCSTITAPLTKLLKKNTKFIWDSDCQNSFEILKQVGFCSDPFIPKRGPGNDGVGYGC